MTSILTSNTLGLFNSSLNVLGAGFGSSQLGRFGEQVYVNGATGNLVLQNQDELLVGLGPDASLVRTYNSQGLLNDDNGDNWRLNIAALFNIPGTPNSNGSSVSKRFGDGSEVVYAYDSATGKYVSTDGDGAHDTLSFNSGTSQWTWTDGSARTTETYNSSGQLVTVADVDGNTRSYTYASGLLTRIDTVTSSGNEQVYIDYSGNNITQIRSVTSAGTQTKVRYGYDGSNRLTTVTVDLSPADNSISDGNTYVTTYTYDGTSKRVASITQGDGASVSFTYTNASGTYKLATMTDGQGRQTTFTYVSATVTDVTDALGNVTRYTSSSGRLTSIAADPSGLNLVTSYGYDASNNVTSVTDANGRVTAMEYDASGNLTLSRDAAGNTVTYTYNSNNQRLTQTLYLVADPDGAGSGQASAPITTRYAYDGENHLRFTVSGEGRVTEYRYNTNGTRSSAISYVAAAYSLSGLNPTDALSESTLATWAGSQDLTKIERTDYAYDFRGQVSSATAYETTNSSGVGSSTNASVTQFLYDQRGQLLQTIDARNASGTLNATNNQIPNATTYTYDGLGRQLSATQWIRTEGASTPITRASTTAYSDAQHKTVITLANGLVTTSTYDLSGRLVSVVQSVGATTLGTTSYSYDPAGKLRLTTDPTGVKSYVVYDHASRVVGRVDATGALVEMVYDSAGNAVQTIAYANLVSSGALTDLNDLNTDVTLNDIRPSTNANDRTTRSFYDAANRLAFVLSPTDSGSTTASVTKYVYDGANRLTDVIRYANALTIPATPTLSNITPTASSDDRRTRSFYDNDGRLLGTLDAEGYLTENKYDAAGQLIEQVAYNGLTSSGYWNAGTFSELKGSITTGSSDRHGYTFYNGKGQVIATLDAERFLTEFTYDLAGNATQSTRYATRANSFSGTPVLSSVRPSTAANDQVVISVYNGANQVTQLTTNPSGTVTRNTYDDATGNLIQSDRAYNTSDVRTTRARYDVQGRVLQELTGEGSVALNALGGSPTQTQIDAVWTSYGLTHTYDASGRRTSTTDQNNHKTLYYYDADGRLSHTVNALGEVSQTIYNAFGQAQETVRYTTRISASGLNGGMAVNDATFTSRLAAAANSSIDSHTQTNYTLRGAVKSAVDALNVTTNSYTYNAFGELSQGTRNFSATDSALDTYTYNRRGLLTQTIQDYGSGTLNRTTSTTYDAFGRVKTVTDGNGNPPVTYTYTIGDGSNDKVGRVITLTDALGHDSVTQYDALGRVLKVIDRLGQATTYAYNDANRSVTVTTPEGITVTTVANRHGETTTVTDGTGTPTVYNYDKNGNVTSVVGASGTLNLTTSTTYDHANLVLTTTDARGIITSSFTYDAANRVLTRALDPSGLNIVSSSSYDGQGRSLTMTDANGTVTNYSYDQNGRVTQVAVDPSGLNLRTSFTYDRQGNTVSVTQGVGTGTTRVTNYVFDHLGRRTEEHVDPSVQNLTTTYVYDQNNNLIARREGVSGANALRTTRFVYDANNRLTYSVDGAGAVTKSEYDYEGRVTKTTRYATAISLSGFGNAISAGDITARVTTSTTDQVSQYAYDNDGRLRFSLDALRGLTETQYDAANRVTRQIRYATALGSGVAMTVSAIQAQLGSLANSALDQTTRTVYDTAGRTVFSINTLNQVCEYVLDANGNAVRRIDYATAITLPGTVNETNVRSAVNAIANTSVDESTRTVYDNANRAVFNIDALNYTTENIYDKNGNVIRTIAYAAAITLPGTVNETNIRSAVAAIANSSNDRSTRIVYDASGRAVFTVDALGYAKKSVYDALGQVTSTIAYYNKITATLPASPTIADIVAALTTSSTYDQVTSYGYDNAGRTTSMTDAANNSESYGYDALGNKTSYTNKKNAVWTYQYDAAGHLTKETTPAVSVTRIDPVTLAATTTSESIITRMTYNALGNVITRTEGTGLLVSNQTENASGARTTTYVYDALGRQIQTIFPNIGVYDEVTDKTKNYIGRNETTANPGSTPTNPVSTTYYDALGNAVANKDVLGNFSYKVYDQLGRVKYEIDAERYITAYSYDAFGNQLTVKRYATPHPTTSINTTLTSFTEAGVASTLTGIASANDRTITNLYDKRNLLTEARQPSVYNYDSTINKYFTANPTTRNTYNAFGQVVKQSTLTNFGTDNTANNSDDQWVDNYTYYDRDGRKIAEVTGLTAQPVGTAGALGYLTTYAYDAEGNLTSQTEYVRQFAFTTGTPSAGQYSASGYNYTGFEKTPANAADVSDIGFDRTVTYTYDLLNRKLTETRVNVQYTDATTFQAAVGSLTSTNTYDAAGNLASVTDAGGAVVRNYYDALGRTAAVASPARAVIGNSSAVPLTTFDHDVYGNVVHQARYANPAASATSTSYTIGTLSTQNDQHNYTFYDLAGHAIRAIDALGNASSVSFDAAGNIRKQWHLQTSADGISQQVTTTFEYDRTGHQIASTEIDAAALPEPVVTGVYVSGVLRQQITWSSSVEAPNTTATLLYRRVGSTGAWTSVTPTLTGSTYSMDLGALTADRYEYQITYRRSGETLNYAQTSGQFAVQGLPGTGSLNVVGTAEVPFVGKTFTSVAIDESYSGMYNTNYSQVIEHRVDLNWQSLAPWGDGTVTVIVDTNLGQQTRSALSAADTANGTHITWQTTYTDSGTTDYGLNKFNATNTPYQSITSVSRVQVKKVVNGTLVTLYDTDTFTGNERLLLGGATAGMTGVTIKDASGATVDTCTIANGKLTSYGNGLFSADINSLATGCYTYVPIGTSSVAAGTFATRGVATSGAPMVQEQGVAVGIGAMTSMVSDEGYGMYQILNSQLIDHRVELSWASLAGWGNGAVRITVDTNLGQQTRTLSAADGMSGTVLEWAATYSGNTSTPSVPMQVLSAVNRVQVWKTINGVEVLVYDRNSNVSTANATTTSAGVLTITNLVASTQSVTFEYRRSLSEAAGAYVARAAVKIVNGLFTVDYSDIPNGVYDYRLTIVDANSSSQQVTGTINIARGANKSAHSASFTLFNRHEATYNAFGEITAKSLNGATAVEYFNYDAAGRLWQTNKDDGINKVYFYNLRGDATADIRSETLDLKTFTTPDAVKAQWVATPTSVRRTDTVYDAMGHVVQQIMPSLTIVSTPDGVGSSMVASPSYLSIAFQSTVGTDIAAVPYVSGFQQIIDHRVDLAWGSLDAWGDGDVRMQVVTNLGTSAQVIINATEGANRGVVAWSSTYSGTGVDTTLNGPFQSITSVSHVYVWKKTGNAGAESDWTLVIDKTGSGSYGTQLSWQAPGVPGTVAVLSYKRLGSSDTPTAVTATLMGNTYIVDLPSIVADRYSYTLTYTRTGETTPYAQGSGEFAVQGMAGSGSSNVVGTVESPFVSKSFVSTVADEGVSGMYNVTFSQTIDHRVDLSWPSLAVWGTGDVKIQVDTNLGNQTRTAIPSANGVGGYAVTWQSTYSDSTGMSSYNASNTPKQSLTSVTRVQIWKKINSVDVLIYDTNSISTNERLLLGGATSGLTGVTIKDAGGNTVDTRTIANSKMVSLGNGMYSVDVSDLATGSYTYTPIGTSSLAPGGFVTRGLGTSGKPAVQEQSTAVRVAFDTTVGDGTSDDHRVDLSWASLAGWGTGAVKVQVDTNLGAQTRTGITAGDGMTGTSVTWRSTSQTLTSVTRVQVWKNVNGVDVLLYDTSVTSPRELTITNLPSTAQTVTFEYKLVGDTSYQSKTTARVADGLFIVNYDDLPIGPYEYRLTVLNGSGQAIDLTSVGGNAQGQIIGTIDIIRGGQSRVANVQSTTVNLSPNVQQTVDRWGNVLSSSDPRNSSWVTNYRYDYANHQIEQKTPTARSLSDHNVESYTRLTTNYGYDLRGQQVTMTDANGYVSKRSYNAAGQLTAELRPDGYTVQHAYDTLGREVWRADGSYSSSNPNDHVVNMVYDRKDQLIQQLLPQSITQNFKYDEDGHRVSDSNGLGQTTRYYYDTRGHIVLTRLPMDGVNGAQYFTVNYYDAQGKKVYERNGNGDSQRWTYNYFGVLTSSTDMGSTTTSYTYDYAGGQKTQTNTLGQSLSYEYYANGALKRLTDNTLHKQTYYEYDAAGHQTLEVFKDLTTSAVYQDVFITYDNLGRVTDVKDFLRYDLHYDYDKAGNRRRILTNYVTNDGTPKTLDYWFTYDEMNRIKLAEGKLDGSNNIVITYTTGSGSSLVKGQGTRLYYDGNGNRSRAEYYTGSGSSAVLVADTYQYDGLNRLTNTYKQKNSGPVNLNSQRTYDAAGRVVTYSQYKYESNGTDIDTIDRTNSTYNANGWNLTQDTYRDIYGFNSQYVWGYDHTSHQSNVLYNLIDSYDSAGNVMKYKYMNYHGDNYTNTYTYTYTKAGSYKESQINGASTYFDSGYSRTFYDVNGNVKEVYDPNDSSGKRRDFVSTTEGLILKKTQKKGSNTKMQYYYFADGKQVGTVGDITDADFDYNYTKVSDQYPSSAPTQYTVNEGDTLESVAAAVFGDPALWYFIADANGLDSSSTLIQGQTLTIPNSISNIHNNTDTFKVYNPREMIGSTTPNLPPPPGPAACGGIAMVLMIIVVIIVTIFTAGAALAVLAPGLTAATAGLGATMLAGAIGGAVGSIVQQGLMIASGHQESFSWSAVGKGALSGAITAGVGAGLSASGALYQGASLTTGQMVANAVITNAATQGAMILTGQQEKFSWASVAASAAGAGVDIAMGTAGSLPVGEDFNWSSFATKTAAEGMKSALRQVAVRYDTGGKISWEQVAGDAFGNAYVNSVVNQEKYDTYIDQRVANHIDLNTQAIGWGIEREMQEAAKTMRYQYGNSQAAAWAYQKQHDAAVAATRTAESTRQTAIANGAYTPQVQSDGRITVGGIDSGYSVDLGSASSTQSPSVGGKVLESVHTGFSYAEAGAAWVSGKLNAQANDAFAAGLQLRTGSNSGLLDYTVATLTEVGGGIFKIGAGLADTVNLGLKGFEYNIDAVALINANLIDRVSGGRISVLDNLQARTDAFIGKTEAGIVGAYNAISHFVGAENRTEMGIGMWEWGDAVLRGDANALQQLASGSGQLGASAIPIEAVFGTMSKVVPGGGRSLDELFGSLQEPNLIKTFEFDEGKVLANPDLRVWNRGEKIILDPSKEHIFVIDRDGNFVTGTEIKVGRGKSVYDVDSVGPDVDYKLGHPTLTGGERARISGEIRWAEEGWQINNNSGRYTMPYSDRTSLHLGNVADLLEAGGMPVSTKWFTQKPQFIIK